MFYFKGSQSPSIMQRAWPRLAGNLKVHACAVLGGGGGAGYTGGAGGTRGGSVPPSTTQGGIFFPTASVNGTCIGLAGNGYVNVYEFV